MFLYRKHIKNYAKFTSNFVDDRDFSNFMRGWLDKEGLDKGFYGKSKFADDTLLKGGGQNISLFDSQILHKVYDQK